MQPQRVFITILLVEKQRTKFIPTSRTSNSSKLDKHEKLAAVVGECHSSPNPEFQPVNGFRGANSEMVETIPPEI